MKIIIRTSYFYQIRNFKRNMIPVSTAIWDPAYFHDFTHDYNYIFKDKRGIVNGIRAEAIIKCGRQACGCKGPVQCRYKPVPACPFLKSYRENLETLDIKQLLIDFYSLGRKYKEKENIKEDNIFIVLIVYEAPKNLCSERQPLIDYFQSKGIDCKELDYPIK